MPRQNRVTLFGQIIATPTRGTFMGNRGILHDEGGSIRRPWQVRRWILCLLEFWGLSSGGHDAEPLHRAILPRRSHWAGCGSSPVLRVPPLLGSWRSGTPGRPVITWTCRP